MTSKVGAENRSAEEENAGARRFSVFLFFGFILIVIGIAVILVAAVLYAGGSATVGGVIFVGPVPIVFGAGSDAALIAFISVALAILSVIMFMVMRRRSKSAGG